MTRFPTRPRPFLIGALLGLAAFAIPGCIIPAAIGGMAESYQRTGTSEIPAEYTGISGKSFAVVVSGSRLIQRINDRLILNANPSYAIPSGDLLTVLYNTPQWPAMTRGEVAEMLGVERLVVVEVIEYTLHEPGNQYVWDGVGSVLVSVYETDSGMPDDPTYEKAIRVTFPDARGFMRTDLPESAVISPIMPAAAAIIG